MLKFKLHVFIHTYLIDLIWFYSGGHIVFRFKKGILRKKST